MEKRDASYFKNLGYNLMFELSDQEAEDIVQEFEVLLKQMELLETIDTEGVEEMIYPFEEETSYMRQDVIGKTLSQTEVLLNAAKEKQGHFVVPKVVK